jgi:hypothetical protein
MLHLRVQNLLSLSHSCCVGEETTTTAVGYSLKFDDFAERAKKEENCFFFSFSENTLNIFHIAMMSAK